MSYEIELRHKVFEDSYELQKMSGVMRVAKVSDISNASILYAFMIFYVIFLAVYFYFTPPEAIGAGYLMPWCFMMFLGFMSLSFYRGEFGIQSEGEELVFYYKYFFGLFESKLKVQTGVGIIQSINIVGCFVPHGSRVEDGGYYSLLVESGEQFLCVDMTEDSARFEELRRQIGEFLKESSSSHQPNSSLDT